MILVNPQHTYTAKFVCLSVHLPLQQWQFYTKYDCIIIIIQISLCLKMLQMLHYISMQFFILLLANSVKKGNLSSEVVTLGSDCQSSDVHVLYIHCSFQVNFTYLNLRGPKSVLPIGGGLLGGLECKRRKQCRGYVGSELVSGQGNHQLADHLDFRSLPMQTSVLTLPSRLSFTLPMQTSVLTLPSRQFVFEQRLFSICGS